MFHNQSDGGDERADTFPGLPGRLCSGGPPPIFLPPQMLMLGEPHGKVTPTASGNQLPGSSLPSQVPSSVLAERERRAKRPALESHGSGFKSKPQHSLGMFSGASDFISSSSK